MTKKLKKYFKLPGKKVLLVLRVNLEVATFLSYYEFG